MGRIIEICIIVCKKTPQYVTADTAVYKVMLAFLNAGAAAFIMISCYMDADSIGATPISQYVGADLVVVIMIGVALLFVLYCVVLCEHLALVHE